MFLISLSYTIYVALNAQFIGGVERQHGWIVSRPATQVTAQTFHCEVLISLVYGLFPNGVG